jgi:Transposase
MAHRVNQVLWDEWRQRINRQRESGLSIAEFCRRENVSAHSFYVWRQNIREGAHRRRKPHADAKAKQSPRRGAGMSRRSHRRPFVGPMTASCPTDFLQLPVAAAQTAPWIELALADGTILRLPQQNLTALVTTLRVLRGERVETPNGDPRHA